MNSRPYVGSILVVDDEPAIRKFIQATLIENGYPDVLLAVDGVAAVSLLASHEGEISVIVLDLIMPRMGGESLIHHVVNVHPIPVAIIVQTGYPELFNREDFFALATDTVLPSEMIQKPYDSERLLAEVARAFDCVEKKRKALQLKSDARLHTRLEQIESTLKILESSQQGLSYELEKNQQRLLHEVEKQQHGLLYELGRELVKAAVLALALLTLLYFGIDDFARKVFSPSSSIGVLPPATEPPR